MDYLLMGPTTLSPKSNLIAGWTSCQPTVLSHNNDLTAELLMQQNDA